MNQYYLMAQLPSLDAVTETSPLPITEEYFEELCERFLGKKTLRAICAMAPVPPREKTATGSALLDAFQDGERQLRLALGCIRAERMGKSFDADIRTIPEPLLACAREAAEATDPMEAERYLCRYRLELLESLRPADMFSEAAVVYYGLKLKLLLRMRRFDTERGQTAYETIYQSILKHGEEEESEV